MPSPAEQYLFDHQFGFSVIRDDWGCASCDEDGSDYGISNSYGRGVGGHKEDCELAAILSGAGFEVRYRAEAQGCPTAAEAERAERYASIIKAVLGRGEPYVQAVMSASIDRMLGDTVRINAVAEIPFAVYRTNDVPISDELP